MDEEALSFLERWVAEHINPVPRQMRTVEAEKLAERCISDAREAEITAEQLEEAAAEVTDGFDLIAYMEEALERADELEVADEEEDA